MVAVRKITGTLASSSRIDSVMAMPDSRGIRLSVSTSWGLRARKASSPSWPSAARISSLNTPRSCAATISRLTASSST